MINRSCVRVFVVSRITYGNRSSETQLPVPVVPPERVRIVSRIEMRRVADLWRKQDESGRPFLENSFVNQPNQTGEIDRVGARFGGMREDQHRQRFSFSRARRLIETGVARVAVSVAPRTQQLTSEAYRVARSQSWGTTLGRPVRGGRRTDCIWCRRIR